MNGEISEAMFAAMQCCAVANAAVTFLARVLTSTRDPQVAASAFADLRIACALLQQAEDQLHEAEEVCEAEALQGVGLGGMAS
jgi:hypothetical protein